MSTKVHLDVVGQESGVRRITLEGSITVGRASGCKLRIPSKAISRKHCHIDLSNGCARITDLDSSNGTSIDGTRLDPHEPTELPTDSLLKIGNRKFKVRIYRDDDLDKTIIDQNLATETTVAAAAAAAGLGDTLIDELPPEPIAEELIPTPVAEAPTPEVAEPVAGSPEVADPVADEDDFADLLEKAESVVPEDSDADHFELAGEDDSEFDFFDEEPPEALLEAVAADEPPVVEDADPPAEETLEVAAADTVDPLTPIAEQTVEPIEDPLAPDGNVEPVAETIAEPVAETIVEPVEPSEPVQAQLFDTEDSESEAVLDTHPTSPESETAAEVRHGAAVDDIHVADDTPEAAVEVDVAEEDVDVADVVAADDLVDPAELDVADVMDVEDVVDFAEVVDVEEPEVVENAVDVADAVEASDVDDATEVSAVDDPGTTAVDAGSVGEVDLDEVAEVEEFSDEVDDDASAWFDQDDDDAENAVGAEADVQVDAEDSDDPIEPGLQTGATVTESDDSEQTAESEAIAQVAEVDVDCAGTEAEQSEDQESAGVDSYSDLTDDADDFGAGLLEADDAADANGTAEAHIDVAEVVEHFDSDDSERVPPVAEVVDVVDVEAMDDVPVAEVVDDEAVDDEALEAPVATFVEAETAYDDEVLTAALADDGSDSDGDVVDAELADPSDDDNLFLGEAIPMAEFAEDDEDDEFDDDEVFVAELVEDDPSALSDTIDPSVLASDSVIAAEVDDDRSVIVAELLDDSLVIAEVVDGADMSDVPQAIPVTGEDSPQAEAPENDDFEFMNFDDEAAGSVAETDEERVAALDEELVVAVGGEDEGVMDVADFPAKKKRGLFGWLPFGRGKESSNEPPGDDFELSTTADAADEYAAAGSDETLVVTPGPSADLPEEPETLIMGPDELAATEEFTAVDRSQFEDSVPPDETVQIDADDIAATFPGSESDEDSQNPDTRPEDIDLDDFFKGID